MYRSKHQKGYTTSHEVKTTRFRTWKSGKKWLYGATVLTLTASTLLPIGNLAFQPKTEKAQAASVSSGTLVPGNTSYDTGGHTYSGTEFANSSNYALYGKAVVASNWINLVSSTANSVGLGIFNGSVSAISATTGFTLKSTIKVDSGSSLTDFTKSGDAIGVILTGASKAQLAANAQSSQATNDGLGIRGLPNTVFLGRDLYSNLSNVSTGSLTGIDGSATVNGWTDGPGVVMAIRNTDSSGTLQAANYPSLGSAAPYSPVTNTQNGTAYTFATDTSYALGVASPITSSVQEPITVTWTPDATNTASTGYTSGTLTFNLIAQTTSNGALIGASAVNGGTGGYTLTTHTNLQNSLTVGFVGGTGGNYGNLSVSLNGATITGSKGTEPVPINYLNKVTGQPIPSMAQSSITANVNDTIGAALTAPSSTSPDNNTYTYVVPAAPTGYQANSATTTTVLAANPASTTNTSATTVSNFIVGTTNPNALNVSYTPSQQIVLFNWAKASGTTLANLPNQIAYGATGITDASVVTDNPFSNTTLLSSYATALSNAVPTGYNITQISNGTTTVSGATTAATLAAFTSQNPTVGATSTLNTYTVTLTAVSQTATYTYGYTSTALNTPAIPAILTSTGTTGGSVTTPTGYNTSPQIPSGYYISAIYAGTSASGTLISSSTTNGTNAAWPSGQVYAPTGNQYYIQLAPNTVNVTWFISIDPNPDNDPLNVAQGGFTPTVGSILGGSTTTNYQSQVIDNMNSLTGNTLSTTDNVTYTDGATGIKYIVTGYQYQEGTTTTATNSAPITTYKTFSDLLAAHPYVLAGTKSNRTQLVHLLMTVDQTTITSNSTSGQHVNPATNYIPSSEITSSTNIDGADDDGLSYAINGYNAIVNITGGQTDYWGDATNSLQLSIGTYTENYYALNYLGVQAYTNWLPSHSGGTVSQFLQTLDATSLANDTVTSQTTLEVQDATAITTNNHHIIPRAASYNPSSDLVGASNADGSSVENIETNPIVNGDAIGVLITDSSGNILWVNNSDISLPTNKLQEVTYIENYYALTAQGLVDYTNWQTTTASGGHTVGDFINSGQATTSDYVKSTTELTVTNFVLPFAGGAGNQFLYLMIGLAAFGALGFYFSQRRKAEMDLEVINKEILGKNDNKRSNIYLTSRHTRPYAKIFHTKNRTHLAQAQRKGTNE